ncbi:unnamed protein product [Caenorhabditis auriculariae]|uniref:G protein-coupled receptor n=1 Tax=Caenorhabditis auriculariae TaxID=2777116 RepID=A0A8S1H8M1_9PELO|nr:unnamed protein product [Caenorhabditis auriculariae]
MHVVIVIFVIFQTALCISGTTLNTLVLYLALFQTPKALRRYSILIVASSLTDLTLSLSDIFTQPRVISSANTLAYVCYGPCKYFGSHVCFVSHNISMHLLMHSLYLLVVSFRYRYQVLYDGSTSTSSVFLMLILAYTPPLFQLVMVAPSPYRTAIIDCVKSRMTHSEIVKKLKVSRVLVFRTAQRYRRLGASDDMQRSGRPVTVTTPEAVKAVREKIRRTPERSVRKMAKEYEMSRESMRTIVKDKLKMIPYRMQKGAFLNQKNKTFRMKKARKLLAGTQDGSHLTTLFTDEKILTVETNKNGQNHPIIATDYQSACEKEKILNKTSHPASVMVFAAITADGKTPLVFVDPGVKGVAMSQFSLRKPTMDLPARRRPRSSCQRDSRVVSRQFSEFISAADWPASSPDLNPMDYAVWIYLTEKVSSKNYPSIKALKTALIKKWDEIDDDYPRAVIDAYPKRLKAVIKAKGGPPNFIYPGGMKGLVDLGGTRTYDLADVSYSFSESPPEDVERAIIQRFPEYNFDDAAVNGNYDMFSPPALIMLACMNCPPSLIYSSILFYRRRILQKLESLSGHMSRESKTMHEQLLKALTCQAIMPTFFVVGSTSFLIGKFQIINHPALEYLVMTSGSVIPSFSPLASLICVRHYRVIIAGCVSLKATEDCM